MYTYILYMYIHVVIISVSIIIIIMIIVIIFLGGTRRSRSRRPGWGPSAVRRGWTCAPTTARYEI